MQNATTATSAARRRRKTIKAEAVEPAPASAAAPAADFNPCYGDALGAARHRVHAARASLTLALDKLEGAARTLPPDQARALCAIHSVAGDLQGIERLIRESFKTGDERPLFGYLTAQA